LHSSHPTLQLASWLAHLLVNQQIDEKIEIMSTQKTEDKL